MRSDASRRRTRSRSVVTHPVRGAGLRRWPDRPGARDEAGRRDRARDRGGERGEQGRAHRRPNGHERASSVPASPCDRADGEPTKLRPSCSTPACAVRPHHRCRFVGENRAASARLLGRHAEAPGVVGDLVGVDALDVEVAGPGMPEVEAADAGRWRHGARFGQASRWPAPQQVEQPGLEAVVGAGRVAERRADPGTARRSLLVGQRLRKPHSALALACRHPNVRQPVGQGLTRMAE